MSSKNSGVAHRALDEIVKFQTAITTDLGQFKVDITKAVFDLSNRYNTVVEAVKEISDKHNELAAHVVAVEGTVKNIATFTASEMGKMGGSVQRHLNGLDQVTSSIDLNVLALAELSKEIVGQLVQIDALINRLHASVEFVFTNGIHALEDRPPSKITYGETKAKFMKALELAESDIQEIKARAEKWHVDLVASAFKTVRDRIETEDTSRKEQAVAAQEAKEAAEKLAYDEYERKVVEQEVQEAASVEQAVATISSGGSGSPFPEGAELFGE